MVAAHSTTISVRGFLSDKPVTMLVDTGSAVTLVKEAVWKAATGGNVILDPPSSPLVTANGNPLSLLGTSEVTFSIGGMIVRYPVFIAQDLVRECILGADFLECFQCVVNISQQTLTVSDTTVPLELVQTSPPTFCLVVCAETVTIPGRSQMEIPALVDNVGSDGTYIFTPKEDFMERQKVAVAHSIHSCSLSLPIKCDGSSTQPLSGGEDHPH